ncbi:MAG: ATP-binding protein [Flavobacteriaceae bacterium]
MLHDLLVGQTPLLSRLKQAIQDNELPHFQLLVDENGAGGLALALVLSGDLLKAPTLDRLFNHPDLHFIFPTISSGSGSRTAVSTDFMDLWRDFCQNPYGTHDAWMQQLSAGNKQGLIGKQEIEEFHQKISLKSFGGGAKVVVVWGAEHLNETASNKLLKVLEEPPKATYFMFVTAAAKRILPTLRSRAQMVFLPPLKTQVIATALTQKGVSDAEAENVANRAEGSWAKAITLITNSDADKEFEGLWITVLRAAFQAKNNKSVVINLMQWAEEISRLNRPLQLAFVNYALDFVRVGMLHSYGAKQLHTFHSQHNFKIERFAPFINSVNLLPLVALLEESHYALIRNANSKILFSDLALKLMRLLHQKEG